MNFDIIELLVVLEDMLGMTPHFHCKEIETITSRIKTSQINFPLLRATSIKLNTKQNQQKSIILCRLAPD